MAIPKVSLTGYVVFQCFAAVIVLAGTSLRLWLQRHRFSVLPATLGTFCLCMVAILLETQVGFEIWFTFRQIQAKKAVGQSRVEEVVLDQLYLKIYVAQSFLYVLTIFGLDLSFLAYYYGFSRHLTRSARLFVNGITCYTVLAFLANILMLFLACLPFRRNWAAGSENCAPLNQSFGITFLSFTHLVSDMGVFATPILIILKLRFERWEKGALVFCFGCGAMSIAASLVRFVLVFQTLNQTDDQLDAINAVSTWGAIQAIMGFIALILPTLRAVIRTRSSKQSLLEKSAVQAGNERTRQRRSWWQTRAIFLRPGAEETFSTTEDSDVQRLEVPVDTDISVRSETVDNDTQVHAQDGRVTAEPWEWRAR